MGEVQSLGPGEFVVVGVRGDEARDQELVRVDLAKPHLAHTLLERREGQRFGAPWFTLDGSSVDLVRAYDSEVALGRVALEDTAAPSAWQLSMVLPTTAVEGVRLSRTPDGRLVGTVGESTPAGPRGPWSLVEADAAGQATLRSLDSLSLGEGSWEVMSPGPDELVFYAGSRSNWLDEAPASRSYALVTNAALEVQQVLEAEAGVQMQCHGAPDASALVCRAFDAGLEGSVLIERDAGGWGEPVTLGSGRGGLFSSDASTFIAGDAVRRRADPNRVWVGDIPLEPFAWALEVVAFSPQGDWLLAGTCNRDLIEVETAARLRLEEHVCVEADAPKPAHWSNDGQWIYRGQCARPSEADSYDCDGSLLSLVEARGDCVVDESAPYDLPEGCDERPAVALSSVAVQPRQAPP